MNDWLTPEVLAGAWQVAGCGRDDGGPTRHQLARYHVATCNACLAKLGEYFGQVAVREQLTALRVRAEQAENRADALNEEGNLNSLHWADVTTRLESEVASLRAELDSERGHSREMALHAEELFGENDSLRAEVARLQGMREDAARWRWARGHGSWRRGDDPCDGPYTEFAIRVRPGSDLSCAAMVDDAVDAIRVSPMPNHVLPARSDQT